MKYHRFAEPNRQSGFFMSAEHAQKNRKPQTLFCGFLFKEA